MKRIFLFLSLVLVFLVSKAQNPIVENIFTADPAAMVYNDTVYLYTGHDEGTSYYNMNDWQLFTTTDMVNWTAHGEILNVSAFSWASGDAWAAEVQERDGKFYFYVCAEHNSISGKAIGVAVSDSPTGPFVDARGTALVTNDMTTQVSSTWDDIDPTVFVDDNGDAYIYWGNSGCYYAKLKDNMIELDGTIHFVDLPSYTEAPYIHKKDDTYYLSYAYGWEEQIAYATAPSITGPWTYQGIINTHVNNCNTNHQSIIEFKNQWYFIYHTGDIGGSYQRSVAVDYLFYNADGSIREVVQTRDGVESTEQIENCLPLPVELYYQLNDEESLIAGTDVTVKQGEKITLQSSISDEGGSWEWIGPNDFTASGNEITLNELTADESGVYKAIYTSTCGTKSIGLFDLYVLPLISGKTYTITPYTNADKRVGLQSQSGVNGTNVVVTDKLDVDYQRFVFTLVDGEYFKICPANAPDEALDVYNISTDDGANIVIWEYWGGSGQQYALTSFGDNVYSITARHSGKCLDWDVANSNLIQWTYWGGDNQKFVIEEWVPTNVDITTGDNNIKVYPVPASRRNLSIDVSAFSKVDQIRILNMHGVTVYEQENISESIIQPEMSRKAGGAFLVQVSANDQIYTQKIILVD